MSKTITHPIHRGTRALGAGLLLCSMCHLACSPQWPMYRNNWQRTGSQVWNSPLADPARVPSLAVRHQFPAAGAPASGSFYASPVVAKIGSGYKVYIGSGAGRFYALDGDTLAELWEYPPAASPTTLTSNFTCNPSSFGIASTATIATVNGTQAVIFGAPDHSGGSIGDGHLFALDAQTGALIWRSDVVAHVTGTTGGSLTEKHEQIGFSAPLVWNNDVLVGISDHCDDPIQKGRLVAVHLADGHIDPAFSFCSVSSCTDNVRGGGIWSSPAAYNHSVYATTGNVKESFAPTEPTPDNALSIVKVDQASGGVQWRAQPVSFAADADPDFSSTPSVGNTSCGVVALATEKDGWTHAVLAEGAGAGGYLWSYPPPPHSLPFTAGDGTVHGDDDYKRSGALWADVYITMNGGLNLMATSAATSGGLHRLHAFNVCDATQRLRWLVDVPHASGGYALGQPTVTRGIVYVGTNEGHVVAIADPTLAAPPSYRCANPDVTAASCVAHGYQLVPSPAILADVAVPDGLMMVYNEPALSANSDTDGRVYVATHDFGNASGHVYELTP